jgi:hypothetical protein
MGESAQATGNVWESSGDFGNGNLWESCGNLWESWGVYLGSIFKPRALASFLRVDGYGFVLLSR